MEINTHNETFDVIVVGGGFAGCGAALAAARGGAKTLLVERVNALGGAPATMSVNPFMRNATRIPESGQTLKLSQGIFAEIEDELRKYGAMVNNCFNPEWLKIILNRMMLASGVTLLFNTTLIDADRNGNRLTSITVHNKSGLTRLSAKQFIDCTGDADLAYIAGFPTRLGRETDGLCQPMTLNFLVGNVNLDEFYAHYDEILPKWHAEQAKGYIKNPMDGIMLFRTTVPGVIRLNATRVVKRNPVDGWDLTAADIEAHEQVEELWLFMRKFVKGCEECQLLYSGLQTGVRESRMIDGEHILSADELVACVKFEDRIAAGNYDIDIHNPEGSGTSHYFFPDGQYYTVPFASLIPKNSVNLSVAGRCISVTHEAQASIRIMPIVCTLGEAAGTAAALACRDGKGIFDIDIKELQAVLTSNGAFIG